MSSATNQGTAEGKGPQSASTGPEVKGQRSPVSFHWPRGQEGRTSDGRRTKKILVMGMGSGKLRRWNLLRGILKACTESEEASRTRAVPLDCLH